MKHPKYLRPRVQWILKISKTTTAVISSAPAMAISSAAVTSSMVATSVAVTSSVAISNAVVTSSVADISRDTPSSLVSSRLPKKTQPMQHPTRVRTSSKADIASKVVISSVADTSSVKNPNATWVRVRKCDSLLVLNP